MNRKTLSLPLISALVASAALPVQAQVALSLSSKKTYRENKSGLNFKGGRFDIDFGDGSVIYLAGCEWIQYYPAGYFRGYCSEGTTAYITSGYLNGRKFTFPYLLVTAVNPAIIVEPRQPDLVTLTAAPASTLARPSGGFSDSSLGLYFNLHTNNVKEYILTGYNTSHKYTAKQRGKFESDIVPGVYHYSFPRLRNPKQPAAIKAVIYPMAEGIHTLNNREEGFEFTSQEGKWRNGFVELSYRRPNTVTWKGLSTSVVFASVDTLHFSLKEMQDPTNPESAVVDGNLSVFPSFSAPSDARVQMTTPYVGSYTLPPVLHSGTKALVTLDLERAFNTGGVAYDFSSRKFQMPVIVIDRYTEYEDTVFNGKGKNIDILQDNDKDGYNNLNEWILDSNANLAGSIPTPPKPVLVADQFYDFFFGYLGNPYFGFNVDKKLGTIPKVSYLLERSVDGGATWSKFVSDGNWTVTPVKYYASGSPRSEIRVRSFRNKDGQDIRVYDPAVTDYTPAQPPGTENDQYRVKVTLKKK